MYNDLVYNKERLRNMERRLASEERTIRKMVRNMYIPNDIIEKLAEYVVEQKLILLINQRDENGKYTNRFEENYLNDNAQNFM